MFAGSTPAGPTKKTIMIRISFTAKDKKVLKGLTLPVGTILTQSKADEYGTPMYRFVIANGDWEMTENWVEKDRAWKPKEKKIFEADMNRDRIMDFFLAGDNVPQREFSVMSNAEYKFVKFFRHSGSYQPSKEAEAAGEYRSIFRISLNTDSNIDAAEEEMNWALPKLAKAYPTWNPVRLDVFEHTLSEHGIYFMEWDQKKTFRLMKCAYHQEEELQKFTDLRVMLEYIAKNHYYQDPNAPELEW